MKPVNRQTWVILNDIQLPFEDKRVLWGLVVPFVQRLKPYGIVLNGDIVDCYEISDYDKDPVHRGVSLKRERAAAIKLMQALPKAEERWWLGGNHEDRFRRLIWREAPQLADDIAFESFFKLADYGYKWKSYGNPLKIGKLLLTHGFLVAQASGASAKRHFERLGTSVLIGHTHRLGTFHVRNQGGDHAAFENGCLCKRDGLGYAQYPNWQHGFAIVHIFKGGYFNVQQIRIINRSFFVYGDQMVRAA